MIIMEYLPSDLRQGLVNEKLTHLTEDQVTKMMYNILTAIEFLHAAGLVHRDLKPANILTDGDGKIKLCDFGSTRPILPNLTSMTHDQPKKLNDLRLRPLSPEDLTKSPVA